MNDSLGTLGVTLLETTSPCWLTVFMLSAALNSWQIICSVSDEAVVTFPGALCFPSSAASLCAQRFSRLLCTHYRIWLSPLVFFFFAPKPSTKQVSCICRKPCWRPYHLNKYFSISCTNETCSISLTYIMHTCTLRRDWLQLSVSPCGNKPSPSTQQLPIPHAVVSLSASEGPFCSIRRGNHGNGAWPWACLLQAWPGFLSTCQAGAHDLGNWPASHIDWLSSSEIRGDDTLLVQRINELTCDWLCVTGCLSNVFVMLTHLVMLFWETRRVLCQLF